MLTVTDFTVALLLILFIIAGWRTGLFRALIGPIAFLICAITGMLYFDITQNVILALVIVVFGSVVLSIILRLLFLLSRTTVDKNYRDYIFWGSRLLGSIFSLGWRGSILLSIIILLTFLPRSIFGMREVQRDIKHSHTYTFLAAHVLSRFPQTENLVDSLAIIENEEELYALAETEEFQKLFRNQKMKDLMEDDDVISLIKERDIMGLVSNPKIIELIKDDRLMEQLTVLSKKAYERKLKQRQEELLEEGSEESPEEFLEENLPTNQYSY